MATTRDTIDKHIRIILTCVLARHFVPDSFGESKSDGDTAERFSRSCEAIVGKEQMVDNLSGEAFQGNIVSDDYTYHKTAGRCLCHGATV